MTLLINGSGSVGGNRKRAFRQLLLRHQAGVKARAEPAYQRLALQLDRDLGDRRRSALLVSPTLPANTSYGAAVLAHTMGDILQRRILLVDACTSHEGLSQLLECERNRGLLDWLHDPALPLSDLVLPSTHVHVSILPSGAGRNGHHPVTAENAGSLLKTAAAEYDFVVMSGGSIMHNALSVAIAPHAGCVLLLVAENRSVVTDVDEARRVLSFSGASNVGIVLTTDATG
jgi:MinD-like ATPase involved in chromosome partitioning or flagellar assembly